MNIKDYYLKINSQCQNILGKTLEDTESFGQAYHLSSCIYNFSENIADLKEKEMLNTVCNQLEASNLNLALGLYRQAFSSLRLAFEMGLGVVHFSVNKLEHTEWLLGKNDITWSKVVNSEDGVLSTRFFNAFFPEIQPHALVYRSKASETYRSLSEYVHGNHHTWISSGMELKLNQELVKNYFIHFKAVTETILLVLCCRYLKSFTTDQLDSVDHLAEELNFIPPLFHFLRGETK